MKLNLNSYKGARDLYPEQMRIRNYIFATWRKVVEKFGYQEYAAPLIEPVEIYAAKSGQEIVGEQTYRFTDRGGREIAIRPEMTPSVGRMVAARRQEIALPARLYSIANFMRYERPQHGREREFWQLNFDLFGASEIEADAEIIFLSHEILREFGANDEMFEIRLNDRRLTDFLMREFLNLNQENAAKIIKLIDKKDKMEAEKFFAAAREIFVANFAEENSVENSGNFAKFEQLIATESLSDLKNILPANAPTENLVRILEMLAAHGVRNARFSPTLMRGFDYYTGIVFEVFDLAPENRRSLFGGGRYDGLVGLFGVENLPVVGAAPGETMTLEFLRAHDLLPNFSSEIDAILLALDSVDAEKIAQNLREKNLKIAVDFTSRKLDKKIKAAAKAGVKNVIFVGEKEMESGIFSLKNLETGEQIEGNLTEIAAILSRSEK